MSSFPEPEKIEREFFHGFIKFNDRRILEIGCGDGRTLSYYAEAAQVIGLDNDRAELTIAQKDYPVVPLIHGSADSLPFADSSFDLTILSWSL